MNTLQEWWRPTPAAVLAVGSPGASQPAPASSAVAFWALVVFTGVLLLAPQIHFPVLMPLRVALWPAVVACGAYLLDCLSRHRAAIVFDREITLTLSLAGWAVATVPLSLWPGGSVELLEGLYLKAVVVFWLLASLVTTLPRFRTVAWVLSLMSLALALTGIHNYFTGVFLQPGGAQVMRIQGYEAALTSNPNDLALMLNLILPLSGALLLTERRGGRRFILLVALAVSVIGIVLTFSRGGFVTLAAIGLMYLWKFRRRPERRWLYAALVVAALCTPLLPAAYVQRITTMTDIDADATGSAEARWRDLSAAVRYVVAHPVVGAGIGSDQLALNRERGSLWLSIHNAYLQYGIDLGLPGLVLFVLILAGCLRRLRRTERAALRERNPGPLPHFAQAMQISLGAFAVAALFHPIAYNFYFYYLGGLALGLSAVTRPRPGDS